MCRPPTQAIAADPTWSPHSVAGTRRVPSADPSDRRRSHLVPALCSRHTPCAVRRPKRSPPIEENKEMKRAAACSAEVVADADQGAEQAEQAPGIGR